jgi:hypothetical protein
MGYFPDFLKQNSIPSSKYTKVETQYSVLPSYLDISKFNLLHAGNLDSLPKGLIEGFKLFFGTKPNCKEKFSLLLIGPSSHFEVKLFKVIKEIPELIVKIRKY